MVGLNLLVFSCSEYVEYSKAIIEDYSNNFSNIEKCYKCKVKSPKCWRNSYIYYKKEPDNKILVILFKCCNTTKAILPSYLMGEKGIGSNKRINVLKDLSNTKKFQKEIAKIHNVSEATVTRIKQKYMAIIPEDIISEIIQTDCDYPASHLQNKNLCYLSACRNIANYNYNLIAIYKTIKLKIGYGDQIVPLYLQQMSCLSYYKLQKENIRIVVVNQIE